jgi:alkylhydroperoxidase family enzyme
VRRTNATASRGRQLATCRRRPADDLGHFGEGVAEDAWANAAKHYDDDQLAAIVCQIAVINAFNRMNVILQRPAGDYQPGQFG